MTRRYLGTSVSNNLDAPTNRQSLIELYRLLRPSLRAYVCSMGLTQDGAEDVIQETFLRLVRHTMEHGLHENLRAWAFRVARNISVDFHRCERRRCGEPDPILHSCLDPAPNPEQRLIFDERMRRLQSAWGQLTPRQRDCVLLRAEGLRYRQIALVLGVSVQRVGEMMQRAITILAISE